PCVDRPETGDAGWIQVGPVQQKPPLVVDRLSVLTAVDRFRGEEVLGCPTVVLGAESEVEVRVERTGHGTVEERANALTRNPPNELARQEPERVDVVAVLRSGLPPRLFLRKRRRHEPPVVDVGVLAHTTDRWQPRSMRE